MSILINFYTELLRKIDGFYLEFPTITSVCIYIYIMELNIFLNIENTMLSFGSTQMKLF